MGFLSGIGDAVGSVVGAAGSFLGGSPAAGILPYAPLIGAGLSFLGGERRNRAQSAASAKQIDFQERMSSTAYQRGMADMRKAGLNPILAGRLGGASSPGGSMPQFHDTLTPAVQTGFQVAQAQADVGLKQATTALTESKKLLTDANIPWAQSKEVLFKYVKKIADWFDKQIASGNASSAFSDEFSDVVDAMRAQAIRNEQNLEAFGLRLERIFSNLGKGTQDWYEGVKRERQLYKERTIEQRSKLQ